MFLTVLFFFLLGTVLISEWTLDFERGGGEMGETKVCVLLYFSFNVVMKKN